MCHRRTETTLVLPHEPVLYHALHFPCAGISFAPAKSCNYGTAQGIWGQGLFRRCYLAIVHCSPGVLGRKASFHTKLYLGPGKATAQFHNAL